MRGSTMVATALGAVFRKLAGVDSNREIPLGQFLGLPKCALHSLGDGGPLPQTPGARTSHRGQTRSLGHLRLLSVLLLGSLPSLRHAALPSNPRGRLCAS